MLRNCPVFRQPAGRTPTTAFKAKIKSRVECASINTRLSAGNDFQKSGFAIPQIDRQAADPQGSNIVPPAIIEENEEPFPIVVTWT